MEYCLSWWYYTGNQAGTVSLATDDAGNLTPLQEAIFNFYSQAREEEYWMEKNPEQNVLFTECTLSTVVNKTYTPIAVGIARRCPQDIHVKKFARESSAKKILKLKTIAPEVKRKIAELVFKN